jgi:hypothetical protein
MVIEAWVPGVEAVARRGHGTVEVVMRAVLERPHLDGWQRR